MSRPLTTHDPQREMRMKLRQFGGPQLWTRHKAREIRSHAAATLEQLEPGGVFVIDASDIEVFDYSFANELFGKTVLELPINFPGRFVVVENLTEYTRENLARALETLSLMIIERDGPELRLLGKVHPTDEQTFAAIKAAGRPVTAANLGDELGVNLTAMNERLAKLLRLGLVRREKTLSVAGREQYLYSTLD
jgi:hypothetical protein